MGQNITYLFGAGASYNSCPVWKEQAEKMIELPVNLQLNFSYSDKEKDNLPETEKVFWQIGYIGKKAKEFSTVDAYAKKLFLSNDIKALEELKYAVSAFFTLWSLTANTEWKNLKDSNNNFRLQRIDQRYINLLATYLESSKNAPKLKKNIKFITWNYDLQIEAAFTKFANLSEGDFTYVDDSFHFMPDANVPSKELDVCHLNGFHGFYGHDRAENLFKRSDSADIRELIKHIAFIDKEIYRGQLSFNSYMNFAWETDSAIAKSARDYAIKTFTNTNILVVIGYSFPPFNHEIDKSLFDVAKSNLKRVIIQNPNGDADYIAETFGIEHKKIKVVKNTEQFVIPNYYEDSNDVDVVLP